MQGFPPSGQKQQVPPEVLGDSWVVFGNVIDTAGMSGKDVGIEFGTRATSVDVDAFRLMVCASHHMPQLNSQPSRFWHASP